ncbi:YpmS family protein [Alkalihalobacterium chitinilyticum]|uniref:YpmS family protein n=1 Tax=Alkalihalobacterium chitinilyticum TaxID=2980103 RepID=A0ABT5VHP7_9BACI|nr:YpmS family protein [Alkalihalobacterium chitinilyticum]MDE5414971.1 YpmS family protein [Alkalihalobacterium chitinilyticum]
MKKTINWKISFFILAGINIIFLLTVFIIILTLFPAVDKKEYLTIPDGTPEANFTIHTTRDEINQLIQLKLLEQPNHLVTYDVYLSEEQIEFKTMIPILSRDIGVQVDMVPEVAPNGDLLLNISTISMGDFQIPRHLVLQMLMDYISFPSYVNIYPNDQLVHLNMSEITEEENISFSFSKFDLLNNEIELLLKVQ